MPKPANDARLAFRLPSAVADNWRKKAEAAGLSLSDFVRDAIDAKQKTGIASPKRKRQRRNFTPADPALLRQLGWIGNNINQLSRWVGGSKSGVDSVELLTQLNALRRDFSCFLLPLKKRKSDGTNKGT